MILFYLASIIFSGKRILRYLRFLQQDAYIPKRFLQWFWNEKAFDTKGSLLTVLYALLPYEWSGYVCGFFLLIITIYENNPLNSGKVRLKLTPRCKRIWITTFCLYLILQPLAFSFAPFLGQILLFQALPLLMIAAVYLLFWDENRRQEYFTQAALQKFRHVSPYVIGITGSYGKTSTKDALAQLLQITLGSTYWPAGGINTKMGIARSIIENCKPLTKYAVIEMAAYGLGSIKNLCDFTPPSAGIITGVGLVHLDRFGDLQTIYQAKSELAKAIPANGVLVCNGDNPGSRQISVEHRKRITLLYGLDNSNKDLDCWIQPLGTTIKGTEFAIQWKGAAYKGMTPLHGTTSLSNCAAAFTMACALGADPEYALAALSTLSPVNNRLQISQSEGRTYIHDAYNSNPEGFLAALKVMSQIPAQKRVLMTPGMIELAEKTQDTHLNIAKYAAAVCDLAIIVGKTNSQLLSEGLLLGGLKKDQVILASNRKEAFEHLSAHLKEGDVVLIENDLPDLYENKERF